MKMEKTQSCQHVFTANRVSLKLQDRRMCDQGVRLYFEKKRRKCMTDESHLDNTPYRYSLSQQNGLAVTRGKSLIGPTFSARRRLREKEQEREKGQENDEKNPATSLLTLPRISPQGSRQLLSFPTLTPKERGVRASKTRNFERIPDILRPRNSKDYWENKMRGIKREKSNLIESQRSYEEIMRLREKHLMSCNLLKPASSRSLTLPQLKEINETRRLKYFEYRNAFEGESSSCEDEEDGKLVDFSKTLNDGSRVVASDHKLSIEVFMPKIYYQ